VHGIGEVLDLLLPEVLVLEIQLAPDLLLHCTGDADSPRLRQPFQACRGVHAVAVDPIILDHHIAKVDPDAELHAAFTGQRGVPAVHDTLNLDRTAHSTQSGRKLCQEVVPREVRQTPPVLPHEHGDFFTVVAERADRGGLVIRHQSGVPDHIRAQNRGEPAFGTKRVQWPPLR